MREHAETDRGAGPGQLRIGRPGERARPEVPGAQAPGPPQERGRPGVPSMVGAPNGTGALAAPQVEPAHGPAVRRVAATGHRRPRRRPSGPTPVRPATGPGAARPGRAELPARRSGSAPRCPLPGGPLPGGPLPRGPRPEGPLCERLSGRSPAGDPPFRWPVPRRPGQRLLVRRRPPAPPRAPARGSEVVAALTVVLVAAAVVVVLGLLADVVAAAREGAAAPVPPVRATSLTTVPSQPTPVLRGPVVPVG